MPTELNLFIYIPIVILSSELASGYHGKCENIMKPLKYFYKYIFSTLTVSKLSPVRKIENGSASNHVKPNIVRLLSTG